MDKKKNELTEGPILKQLFLFFLPILIGAFFQQFYNTADSIIVGRFAGKEALACVGGSSAQITSLVVGFFTGLAGGCSVVIAQRFGAKKKKELEEAVHTAYAFAIAGGFFFSLIFFFACKRFLRWMNTPEILIKDSTIYMQIYFSGLLFMFLYNIGASVMRALGDSKKPLYYLVICSICNVVLDLLFVAVCHWGVAGAALATWIAQTISAILVTGYLMSAKSIVRLGLRNIRFYKAPFIHMMLLGFPTGFQSVLYSCSNMVIQTNINGYGVDYMAAWGTLTKIDSFFWMINTAMSVTTVTFVGQNYGAMKKQRIKDGVRQCLILEIGMALLFSVFMFAAGRILFGCFTTDQDVIRIGMRFVQIISPFYFLFAFIEIFSSTLRAEGSVLVPTVITLVGICFTRLIWNLYIVAGRSMELVAASYPGSWVIADVAMILYFTYKQKRIMAKIA